VRGAACGERGGAAGARSPANAPRAQTRQVARGADLTQFQMAQFLANLVQARERCMAASARLCFRRAANAGCCRAAGCVTACSTRRTRASCPTCCCGTWCSLLFLFGAPLLHAAGHTIVSWLRRAPARAAGSFYYSKHVAPKKGAAAKGGKKPALSCLRAQWLVAYGSVTQY
jgi:hypothetical protein